MWFPEVPFQVPNPQNQSKHAHGPSIKLNFKWKIKWFPNVSDKQIYTQKYAHARTLDMSGGFLGSIPPYFFFTDSSYKVHKLVSHKIRNSFGSKTTS